jgi:fucose permease
MNAMSPEQHRGARAAISCLFVMIGLLAGTWFTRIPAVMERYDLATGQVGFLLLCFSLGALVVFQVVGRAIARFGSSRVVTVGGVGMCMALALLAIMPTPYLLALVLFADGVAFGGLNVALNAKGVATEQHLGYRIMGSLHGFFTAGMLLGSIVAALVARAGVGPEPHFAVMAAIGLVILALAGGNLLPDQAIRSGAEARERHVLLPRVLWPLGMMAFCASISEGAMYDWSALYVHQELGGSEATGAAAFAAFSLAVLVGRFGGDRVVDRFGPATVVRLGSAIAGAGLLSGLVVDSIAAVACGFAALGLGV